MYPPIHLPSHLKVTSVSLLDYLMPLTCQLPPSARLLSILFDGLVMSAVQGERHHLKTMSAGAPDGDSFAIHLNHAVGHQLCGDQGKKRRIEHGCILPHKNSDFSSRTSLILHLTPDQLGKLNRIVNRGLEFRAGLNRFAPESDCGVNLQAAGDPRQPA